MDMDRSVKKWNEPSRGWRIRNQIQGNLSSYILPFLEWFHDLYRNLSFQIFGTEEDSRP